MAENMSEIINKAIEKNCVVIVFKNGWAVLERDPYLATMEEAIKDCLDFNIGYLADDETEQYADELREIDSLLKKKAYQEAWDYWVENVGNYDAKYIMQWYKLGNKSPY